MKTDDLLIRYLLGEAGPAERVRIEQMLATDERQKERFRQFVAVRDLSDRTVPPVPDWREAYGRFRLGLQRREEFRPARRPVYGFAVMWRIAAFMAGIFVLAVVLFVHRKKESKTVPGPAGPASITVSGPGPVRLPDGSVVKLGTNSMISYAFGRQASNRMVYLDGQAFFSVAPDASKPFIIHVSDLTLKVLGTSFSVREEGSATVVEMATGAVEVSRGRTRRVIKAGDTLMARRNSDTLVVSSVRIDAAPPKNHRVSTVRRAVVPSAGLSPASPDTANRRDEQLETVRSIIADLVNEKIVPNKAAIDWFGLDDGQFVVNDKHLPDSLLVKFRARYVRNGMGYYYGSVKVLGRGYFFSKKDLDDH